MSEQDLKELSDLINGRGAFPKHWRGWFHTWPGRDADADKLHTACCTLAERGDIERVKDENGHSVFSPVGYVQEVQAAKTE